jgi:DNA-directed RNA polymerase specialized sigma24 family protein
LIQQLQNADLEALGLLFERHRARVYHTALAIVRDPEAAEDILQDCFLKVYVNAKRIDPNRPLAPWLYRVTVNLSYTWLSRRNGRRTPFDDAIDNVISPMRQAPDRLAEQTETRQKVRRAIATSASISAWCRAVLSDWAGLAGYRRDTDLPLYGEIALYYARENLRSKMGAYTSWLSEGRIGYL